MLYPELDTPCIVIDLDRAERNVRRMQAIADAAGVKLRPHTKTHKAPFFAHMQVAAGAAGITCAKLGEAEVMAEAGLTDILIAYPLIGNHKLDRLAALSGRVERLIVTLDSYEVAEALSSVGERLGRPLDVYLEVDTGQHRVGRQPGADAIAFARGLERFPGIRLAGVMSHAGPSWKAGSEAQALAFARREVAALGLYGSRTAPCGFSPPWSATLRRTGPLSMPAPSRLPWTLTGTAATGTWWGGPRSGWPN